MVIPLRTLRTKEKSVQRGISLRRYMEEEIMP